MNGYVLTRRWFDFAYGNPNVRSQHTALYCWCIELNNRLQWKEYFGLPTEEGCEFTGIGNRKTFYSALEDLKKWGFIDEIQASKNQSQARIISLRLCEFAQAENKQDTSTDTSTDHIDKQPNNETSKTIKKTKKKNEVKEFVPPTIEQVEAYFLEQGADLDQAERCFFYYKDLDWHNKYGKKLSNWKSTMRNNWILKNQNNEQTFDVSRQNFEQMPQRKSHQFHETYNFTPNQ